MVDPPDPGGPVGPAREEPRVFDPVALEETLRALQSFRERYAADRAEGRKLPPSEYAALFPGHEDLVREDFRRLQQEDPPVRVSASPFKVIQSLLRAGRRDVRPSAEIARGGMGVVYRLRDPVLDRDLALKVGEGARVPVDGEGTVSAGPALRRMLQEAQITAQLSHPGVVPVHELGIDGEGRLFFTMKLVRGRTLAEVFRLVREDREGWTLTRVIQVFIRICETIAFAHSKGVLHRDIKPANVMVGTFGEVYVMDWGVAKVVGDPAAEDLLSLPIQGAGPPSSAGLPVPDPLTMAGDVVGTPEYMPPEQAGGRLAAMDRRADVYSIGAMLYQLLADRAPYEDPSTPRTPVGILQSVLRGPPERLAALDRRAPPELQAVCEKAMARDPDRRYASATELANDLHRFLEGRVVRAYRTGPLVELKTWIRRNAAVAATAAAAVALVVAGAVRYAVVRARDEAIVRGERDAARMAERREAEERRRAVGMLLAARAADLAPREPALALQIAVEAAERAPGPEAEDALHAALSHHHERRRLVGHDGYVLGGGWSPDGTRVLTWEWGRAAILWEAASGRLLARLLSEEGVHEARFSPDGRSAATASEDGAVALWDGGTGARLWRVAGAGRATHALAFDPVRPLLAAAGVDGAVRLRRREDGREERTLGVPGTAVASLSYSPDGRVLAALDTAGGCRLFDTGTGAALLEWAGPPDVEPGSPAHRPPHAVSFAAGGRLLVTWTPPGRLRIHALEGTGARLVAEEERCGRPGTSGDGARVAFCRWTGEKAAVLDVRDAADPGRPRLLPVESWSARVSLDRTGRRAAALVEREVVVLDLESGRRTAVLRGHRYDMKEAIFSPDGSRLLTASADMTARLWDPEPPDTIRLPPGLREGDASPDGARYLEVGPAAGDAVPVRIVEAAGGATAATFALPGPVASVRWLPDGLHLLASCGGRLLVVAARDGAIRGSVPMPDDRSIPRDGLVEVSRDLSRAAFKDGNDALAVADFASSSILPARLAPTAIYWTFSPDGRRLLVSDGRAGTGTIWDVDGARPLRVLAGHTGYVIRVAWSPDGRRVATSAVEGRVRVWDPDTGEQVAVVEPVPMRGNPVSFADGHRLLLVHAEDEVRVCDADTGRRMASLRPGAEPGLLRDARHLPGPGAVAIFAGEPPSVRRWPLDALSAARARLPIDAEPSIVRKYDLVPAADLEAYEEEWLRRHPTGRAFAMRGIAHARKGRVEEGLRWIDAARILQPRLEDVDWAEACVRARRSGDLPAGPGRDAEVARALEALKAALGEDGPARTRALKEPLLAPLRSDPRWRALVGE